MKCTTAAREIAHDIFSLAQSCGDVSLRSLLEREALLFLRAVARRQPSLADSFIASCEALIIFGNERDFFELSTAPCLNKIKHWQLPSINKSEVADRKHNSEDISEIIVSEFENDGEDEPVSDNGDGDLNMEVRQHVLLTKIGELQNNDGGCGLKELLPLFPGITDRTLRSDFKKMLEKGLIIRIGSRGPNTAYRLTGSGD